MNTDPATWIVVDPALYIRCLKRIADRWTPETSAGWKELEGRRSRTPPGSMLGLPFSVIDATEHAHVGRARRARDDSDRWREYGPADRWHDPRP